MPDYIKPSKINREIISYLIWRDCKYDSNSSYTPAQIEYYETLISISHPNVNSINTEIKEELIYVLEKRIEISKLINE